LTHTNYAQPSARCTRPFTWIPFVPHSIQSERAVVKVRFIGLPLRRAFGTVTRLKERKKGSGSCGTPNLSSRLPSGWPSVGSHPLRLSGGGASATDARKAPDPHKCFLCVRGIPHVSAPARASPRGTETSHKNHLYAFGGGGSNPAFLACGADGLGAARSSHAPPQKGSAIRHKGMRPHPSASLFRRRVSVKSAGVCVVVRPTVHTSPAHPGPYACSRPCLLRCQRSLKVYHPWSIQSVPP